MKPQGSRRLVVAGGDAAGMTAASQVKRRTPETEVIVLEQGRYISYAACGMPYMISGVIPDPDALLVLKPETAREKRGLDVRLGHKVVGVDPAAGRVTCEDVGGGGSFDIEFDRLLLATGARPAIPRVEGVDLAGVMALRDYQSGLAFKAFVADRCPASAVIVGAGLIGLEMAESLTASGVSLTMLKRTTGSLLGLESELSELVQAELARHGVNLLLGTPLSGIEDDGRGNVSAVRAGGETLNARLVLIASGIRPNAELAESAGLALGAGGAISVNERLQTSAENVYAAGDCVEQTHLVTGSRVFISQALSANRMGRVAGANLAADLAFNEPSATYLGTVGSTVVKVFDLEVGLTGLNVTQARKAGLDARSVVIKSGSRAHYYPGSSPLRVGLVFETGTGRLLGGQLVGHEGVAKRVDVLAAALHSGMNVDQLSRLDLCYAPPFAPVWDPVLVAATVALKKV